MSGLEKGFENMIEKRFYDWHFDDKILLVFWLFK